MQLYAPLDCTTRWSSFENPSASKGGGGQANKTLKGAAFAPLAPGQTAVLLDAAGPGVVRRMWLTVRDRSPQMLRSLRLDCYWDSAAKPAVSVPLGDFFGATLGRTGAFESELFCSPEGRSFCSYVPMPFHSHARITLTNESQVLLSHVFYDINFTLEPLESDAMYFHAAFSRQRRTTIGRDFEILPLVCGRGRYIGAHIGVITPPEYEGTWWGEGEVKVFLDGDREFPTLCGTGTEDYISTGWGQARFHQRFHGSTLADAANRQWGMYRYHIPDPICFQDDCRVTLQQIGGGNRETYLAILQRGAAAPAISTELPPNPLRLLAGDTQPFDASQLPPKAWVNFLRSDDVSAVSLFYLNCPENGLPVLPPVAERTHGLLTESKP